MTISEMYKDLTGRGICCSKTSILRYIRNIAKPGDESDDKFYIRKKDYKAAFYHNKLLPVFAREQNLSDDIRKLADKYGLTVAQAQYRIKYFIRRRKNV